MIRPISAAAAAALALAAGTAPHVTPSLASYARAREVLDAGITAAGGLTALRGVRSLRRSLSGAWVGSGQHPRPYPFEPPTLRVPPANGRTVLTSFIDYAGRRSIEEAVESDVAGSDSIVRVTVAIGASGFETLRYREERPFHRVLSESEARSLELRRLRHHPEGVLLMAFERPETLQWVGMVQELGRSQKLISFTDPLGTRVFLAFDAESGRLTKSETLREHALAGDSSAEVFYLDYRQVGALLLPFHYIDRTAGVPVQEMRVSALEVNAAVSEDRFTPPREFARWESDPADPTVQRLGDGLFLIRGSYNVVFAAFRDHVVVFEAPVSSRYMDTCLALIRATLPDKPVRAAVASHFHYDHVAGVRPFVASGLPILTTADAEPVIERVAASTRTLHPDLQATARRKPRIEIVRGRRVLDDGANRAELYDFGPTEHVAELLVAYFPAQRVLYQADVWDPVSSELHIAGADTVTLARRIEDFGLRVERIVPVHGIPTSLSALESGLSVRAKYGR
jgi:hypothetical protein